MMRKREHWPDHKLSLACLHAIHGTNQKDTNARSISGGQVKAGGDKR